ncbi:hypothetical protein [Halobacterium litoreum]|uniref:Uncharacterized protein n=1 Tax=Halobacterium litoreum TaxID=2039234 RepID=A0ABD5NB29_9EURY|nr:hypothetical protein [Halobacterium litoreum]UHH14814.1 hypothetical protein LT972_07365 [Halobacterium litoreum]
MPGEGDEDESDSSSSFTAAVIGGGAGFAIGGPAGAAAGAAIASWLDSQQEAAEDGLSEHHSALLRAAQATNEIADERGGKSASLYLAHIDGDEYGVDAEDGNTRNVLSAIDGDPDLIYSDVGGPTGSMIVEVETAEALTTQKSHVLEQLEDYRLSGYQTVLAMPAGQKEVAEEFVEENDVRDPIYVVEARAIGEFLY